MPRRCANAFRAAGGATILVLVLHCGEKGPPLPPEPRGPLPPAQVRARQVGREVRVGFRVPEARGDREAQQPFVAEVVRISYPEGIEPGADPDAFRRRGVIVDSIEGDPLRAGEVLSAADRPLEDLLGSPWGQTLRYAVRVRDRRGRSSPLVVAGDLILDEPADAPRDLVGEPTADGIRLRWESPEGQGPFRYNLYRTGDATSALDDPLNRKPLETPEYLDTTVSTGESYTYRVRVALAEDPPYRESADSNSVRLIAEDRFAPSAPRGVVAVQEGHAVRLFWDPNPERDVRGYRVYRQEAGGSVPSPWERVGPDPVERPLYLDPDVRIGQRLRYRVSAIDRTDPPNEGPPSEAVDLVVLSEPSGPVPGGR